MDKQSPPTDPSRTSDKRQQANTNPDRPPVDPDDPRAPDPFDPFETAVMTDGGGVVQDQTELQFETHLSNTLPSTTSPPTPGTSDTPTPDTPSHPGEPGIADSETPTTVGIEDGTLVHTIIAFFDNEVPEWTYVLESKSDTIAHHAVKDANAVFSIRKIVDSFCVYHEPERKHITIGTDPNKYSDFEVAMAAFIEGIDWGSLPPGDGHPEIWSYTGYSHTDETFQEYLSGRDNSECGEHYFAHEKAEYGIHIASYADLRASANPGQTLTVVTLTDAAEKGRGNPIFRTRFPGQQQAFNRILTALSNGLSSEIALHSDEIGNITWIPSIETLQHRP